MKSHILKIPLIFLIVICSYSYTFANCEGDYDSCAHDSELNYDIDLMECPSVVISRLLGVSRGCKITAADNHFYRLAQCGIALRNCIRE